MVKQYPHSFTASVQASAFQDANGNWVPGSDSAIQKECRAEANDKGNLVTLEDGSQFLFSWMVYMPLPVSDIPPGSKIDLFSDAGLFFRGDVKRFNRGQLNARIWL